MNYLRFTTPTALDLRELFTLGLGSKRNVEGKIGHKGSGMKFTLALLHRLGSQLMVNVSGSTWTSLVRSHSIRGNEHDLIVLTDGQRDIDAHISLHAGEDTWSEAWFALRELLQNCLDEGGVFNVAPELPTLGADGGTDIALPLTAALQSAWDNRSQWYHGRNASVVYESDSPGLYYHGFLILPGKDWARAYDVTDLLTRDHLSEDRQARNVDFYKLFRDILKACPALPDAFYTSILGNERRTDNDYLSQAINHEIYHEKPDSGGFTMAKLDAAWFAKHSERACWTDERNEQSQEWYYAKSAGYDPVFVPYHLARLLCYSASVKAAQKLMPTIEARLRPVAARSLDVNTLGNLKLALRLTKKLRPEGCEVNVVAAIHEGDRVKSGAIACIGKNKVLLLEDWVKTATLQQLVETLVEEFMHLVSEAGDCTRAFEEALIKQLALGFMPKVRRNAEFAL